MNLRIRIGYKGDVFYLVGPDNKIVYVAYSEDAAKIAAFNIREKRKQK